MVLLAESYQMRLYQRGGELAVGSRYCCYLATCHAGRGSAFVHYNVPGRGA